MKKVKYKGWLIKWDEEVLEYLIYTPWELEQPPGFRYHEMESATIEQAKVFIDNY